MTQLGIGIIGSGFMGQTYAKTVQSLLKKATLVGVAEGTRAPGLAKEYGIRCFTDYRELVQSDDIHLILIATPHAQHAEEALAAVDAGKHLLIDKPMATTVEACDAILDGCRAKNLKCSITYTQRYRVGFAKAKEGLDSGALGCVLEIRTYQMVSDGMDVVPKWQMDPSNIGLLFGHGVHNFDAIRTLTGQEIKSVFAKCRTLTGAPVEGTSDVLITMEDGAVHYFFCSFEVPKPGFPRSQVGTRVVCEKGFIDIDAYDETRISENGGAWRTLAVQPPIDWAGNGFLDPNRLEGYGMLLQDLVDAVLEDREPEITGWDGRQAVAAALAAYESSNTGKEVLLK